MLTIDYSGLKIEKLLEVYIYIQDAQGITPIPSHYISLQRQEHTKNNGERSLQQNSLSFRIKLMKKAIGGGGNIDLNSRRVKFDGPGKGLPVENFIFKIKTLREQHQTSF